LSACKLKGEIALFQNIIIFNASNPESQQAQDLEKAENETSDIAEYESLFDVEKLFDKLTHGKI